MSTENYIGKVLGNYRIVAQVGGGAFGNVYRAEHLHLAHRVVAIKIMHMAHLDSEEDRERFIKEARLLERLAHPYILPILDVGHSEGFPYIITTYAPNGSLRDRLRRLYPQRLPIEESVRILSQVGEAISFAHMQNVIHRDVKPANILFDERGDALLADFGIATTLASASIKNINEMTGSAPYMAPEQFQGKISKECDQYALGCIAYEMFTGHQPFNAPDFVSMAFKHMTEMPPSPLEYNPDIPPYIEQAILKAIAKDRANRHPSVLAFIQALQPSVDMEKTILASYRMTPANPPSLTPIPPLSNPPLPYQTMVAPGSDATQKVGTTSEYPMFPPPAVPVTPTPIPFYQQQTGTIPTQLANNSGPATPVPGAFPIVQPLQEPITDKRKKHSPLLLIALLAAVVLILIPAAVAAFYTFAYPATATVSIGPSYKDVKSTFTITAVAGTPNAGLNQVGGVRILSSVKSQQKSATATGSISTNAVSATGTMYFINNTNCDLQLNSMSWTDNNGITVTVTQILSAPAGQTGSAPAYATPAGSAGNIPANDISFQTSNPSNCTGTGQVYNGPFSGGVDAGTIPQVQPSDINNVANPLIKSLSQEADTDIQGQVKPSEQLVGTPSCTNKVQSDQGAGAQVSSFNVTVTVSCTGLAYDSQAAQAMAQTMLKGQAQSSPGPHFALLGAIITTPGASKVVDPKKGIITQDITAEGIWAYVFSSADKQRLADFIAGKTVSDAVNLLLNQNGVRTAHININGAFLFWNKIPTNLSNISFVMDDAGIPVLKNPTLHVIGTPTGTPGAKGTPSVSATPSH